MDQNRCMYREHIHVLSSTVLLWQMPQKWNVEDSVRRFSFPNSHTFYITVQHRYLSTEEVLVCVTVRRRCVKPPVSPQKSLCRPFWSCDILSVHSKSWWAGARPGGGNDLRKNDGRDVEISLKWQPIKSNYIVWENVCTVNCFRVTTMDYLPFINQISFIYNNKTPYLHI